MYSDSNTGHTVQLAQREDPVEEKSVDEMQVDQKAANSSDAKTFESGHIAPDPGHQTKDSTDSNQQNEVDAEWALMQPVYDREYTETVKPIHVPAENVGMLMTPVCLLAQYLSLTGHLQATPAQAVFTLCSSSMLLV